jgi:ligand-binding sensor domain-containing protein/nitrate/nitrite-specific signal transduction histidine kinase
MELYGLMGSVHSRGRSLIAWMCGALLLCSCSLPVASDALLWPSETAASTSRPFPSPTPPSAGALPELSTSGAEFAHLSLEEGLSQSVVTAVLQDSQGFVWVATQDGLNRYDGIEFVTYRHDIADPSSISDNYVQALHEDASGYIWVGTHGGGLNRYDPRIQQFTTFRYNPDDLGSISHNNVFAIEGSRDGGLWLGTAAGLNHFDPSTGQATRFPFDDPANPRSTSGGIIQTILEESEDKVWVGAFDGGLTLLNPRQGTTRVYRHDKDDPGSLPDDNVQALLLDGTDALWVGTAAGGLARLDPGADLFVRYQHDPGDKASIASNTVNALLEDRWGRLWVGTKNGGLDRFDGESGAFVHHAPQPDDSHSLSNATVQSLYEDRGGVLWVGTFGGGANSYDPYARKFIHYRNDPDDPASLGSNMVWSFAQGRDGSIWIGTLDAGLNRLEPITGDFTRFRNSPSDPTSLASDQIWALFVDRSDTLWIGSAAGLDRFDAESGSFAHIPAPPIYSFVEDQHGAIWLGAGGGGLGRLDRETGEITYFKSRPDDPTSLSADFVTSVFLDRDGRLWIGTFDAGLNRLDDLLTVPGEADFVRYRNDPNNPASLVHDSVLDIHQDTGGTLWIATDRGLDRLDEETGDFVHYGVKEGLANEVIYAILEDDAGNLWLSTNRGLSRLNPNNGAVRNYTPREGLQSHEFNQGAALRAADGTMYFGGINGFNVFDPAKIRDHEYAPPVRLTRFELFNQPVAIASDSPLKQAIDWTTAVRLSHAQDFFAFEFASLDYAAPNLNRYAYKMEGLDKDWNYTGSDRRYAGYTNVPPGDYTFRVKGANSDGVWSEHEVTLGVTVTPPFWQTWWFRAAVALALAAGIVATYRLRVRGVEARSRELEAQVEKRTHEIEQRQQELAALYRADEELYSHLDVDSVLSALTEIAVHVLKADRSAVMTWDDTRERAVVRSSYGFSPEAVARLSQPGAAEIAEKVGRTGQPAIISETSDADDAARDAAVAGVRSSMHLPIKISDEIFGVFCIGYNTPHAFNPEEQRLFSALAHRAATAIENAHHFDQERRRAEQFHLINEVGQRMNAALISEDLLQQMAGLIQDAFESSEVAIAFVQDGAVVPQITRRAARSSEAGNPASQGHDGLWAWVAEHGEPLMVEDGSPREHTGQDGGGTQFASEICVPLVSKETVIGVLSIAGDQPNLYDEEDLMVLQALANQATTAIENARLYEQGQRVAVMEERSRLARDLHDAVTQTLFSASLIAEALPAIWESDQREGADLLEQLRKLSRGALAEMRTLLLELRPTALADAALPDLMRQLGEAASGRIGVPVQVSVDGPCDAPEVVRVTLYRIAQEALNNVAKHARASEVALTLSCRDAGADGGAREIELQIRDNGSGFDPDRVSAEHLGLGIIRERAAAIGADLQLTSRPGEGALVRVCWREQTPQTESS